MDHVSFLSDVAFNKYYIRIITSIPYHDVGYGQEALLVGRVASGQGEEDLLKYFQKGNLIFALLIAGLRALQLP